MFPSCSCQFSWFWPADVCSAVHSSSLWFQSVIEERKRGGGSWLTLVPHLVGSSKNMTGGLLTSSRAIASLFLWPPDRWDVLVLAQSSNPRAIKISRTWRQTQTWSQKCCQDLRDMSRKSLWGLNTPYLCVLQPSPAASGSLRSVEATWHQIR